jgi:hypothetical protein
VGDGGALIDAVVWASSVVVVNKFIQNSPQMSSIDPQGGSFDQDQIQTFFSGRADPAFRIRVCIRGLDGSGDNVEAFGLENSIKSLAKRASTL